MADDLQNRLQEANKHFTNKAYDACISILNTCPKDDPKVQNNLAVAEFHKSGSARAFLQVSAPTSISLDYEGHEAALLNQAFALQLCGDVAEARRIADGLLPFAAFFKQKEQARLAILLHGLSASNRGTKITPNAVVPSVDVAAVQSADAATGKALQLAFLDASGLHPWFRDSQKGHAEKAVYFNSLAIDAYANGKLAVAQHHFGKALAAAATGGNALCPFTLSAIQYNHGLCLLARGSNAGDLNAAVASLIAAQQGMTCSVRLWLRIGEACTHQYRHLSSAKARTLFAGRLNAQSSALHDDGVKPSFALIPTAAQVHPQGQASTDAITVSLTHATQAFHNVLALLVDYKAETVQAAAQRMVTGGQTSFFALVQALAGLCYVELAKGNYPAAVGHFTDFQLVRAQKPKAVPSELVAAMACYGAEALCAVNKSALALKQLQALDLNELVLGAEDETAGADNATVEALFVNLTIAHIMSAQWQKALALVQSVLSKFKNKYAVLLLVYVELAQGNKEKALEVLEAANVRPPF